MLSVEVAVFRRNLLCPIIVFSFAPVSLADEAAIFDELDSNRDGLLQRDEVADEHVRLYKRLLRIADADDDTLAIVSDYAGHLGLMFQITDDLLDVTETTETLGKTAGKDEAAAKRTKPVG